MRGEETHKGKLNPAHTERVVIYLPDVWSALPTMAEYGALRDSYKRHLVALSRGPLEPKVVPKPEPVEPEDASSKSASEGKSAVETRADSETAAQEETSTPQALTFLSHCITDCCSQHGGWADERALVSL